MFVRARASAERIGEIFVQKNNISRLECEVKVEKTKNFNVAVEFKNVNFSYANAKGEPVLKNISFQFITGETIGII